MTRAIYTPEMAGRLSDQAGAPYRPSNGTEGEMFQKAWCHNCAKDNFDWEKCTGGCPILVNTMAYAVDDAEYPKEWIYGDDGQPKCTAFMLKEGGEDLARVAEIRAKYDALPRDPATGRPII